MKKIVNVVLSLLFVPTLALAQISGQVNTLPGLPQTGGIVATAAPQNRADGTAGIQLADREGNTKEVLGHPEYTESARRGKMFTLASTALTITAFHVSANNIGSFKPIVGFYNPNGSGVNAVIANASAFHTSGTTGGPLLWNFYCGQNWSTAASGAIYNNLLSNNTPNGSAMIAVNNTSVGTIPNISSAMLVQGVFGGPDNTALSSGGEAGHFEDLKGRIVVPPGCLIGLAAAAIGTSDVVNAQLSWEEVAQ